VLAAGLETRAGLETLCGQERQAAATYQEALALRRRLLAESPDFAGNREALVELERQLARRAPYASSGLRTPTVIGRSS
jgi:hypothetical protein